MKKPSTAVNQCLANVLRRLVWVFPQEVCETPRFTWRGPPNGAKDCGGLSGLLPIISLECGAFHRFGLAEKSKAVESTAVQEAIKP